MRMTLFDLSKNPAFQTITFVILVTRGWYVFVTLCFMEHSIVSVRPLITLQSSIMKLTCSVSLATELEIPCFEKSQQC